MRFATVLGDRHHVFTERVDPQKMKFAFRSVLGDRRRVFSERVAFRLTLPIPPGGIATALPTLKQGVIAGVFKNKGAAPWAITRAEKLQLSVFLPNDLSLDDWYAGVYALPTVRPDLSMLGANNLRRVVGYHHLRKKYEVL